MLVSQERPYSKDGDIKNEMLISPMDMSAYCHNLRLSPTRDIEPRATSDPKLTGT